MKVLHITKSAKGGAGIAAKRLHDALCENGVQSGFLSSNLTIGFNNQIINDSFFTYRKPSLLKKVYLKVMGLFFSSQCQKVIFRLQKIEEMLECEIVSLPFGNYKLHEHPLVKEADIINLHWVGDFIDFPSFFKNFTKPIVWTLHDMNPFQGIFHYMNDQDRNNQIAGQFDKEMKQIKKSAIQSVKNGTIVSPSQWLLNEARKSEFFFNWGGRCIPNSINLEIFNQKDKLALRKEKNIGGNEFVILFAADSIKSYRKGFDLLRNALLKLKDIEITVLTIGKGDIPVIDTVKLISLGEISSSSEMAECYSMADVFVLPSREDNLPNVMLEAFACGTPIIGFNTGGIAEHTIENLTGILADEMIAQSLANAIAKFYDTRNDYSRSVIRKYAEEKFSYENQARSYMRIYKSISG
ncbi:glycosyltransferase [Flavobacterium sufflavum]|uniref:Glycosyltransferase n=1 Tax=Flavobacterium sufflavum TaxID=1921138 RepID=A0A3S3SVN8_9FLAO|nr:glycosyltransferase [Flavobacterium sufflavum]RVT75882.1 glycosyltransferase [Flavobacterium sufflavum]